jgi:KTSC domain
MQRTPVTSSTISSVGYDPGSRTLEVAFHSGAVYQYSGVPASVYQGLMTAASHGQYMDAHVKKAGYAYRRVS